MGWGWADTCKEPRMASKSACFLFAENRVNRSGMCWLKRNRDFTALVSMIIGDVELPPRKLDPPGPVFKEHAPARARSDHITEIPDRVWIAHDSTAESFDTLVTVRANRKVSFWLWRSDRWSRIIAVDE